MSVILGLNFSHADSAASLLIDGELVAAIAEERLGDRLKHDPRFPSQAIKAVLEEASVKPKDLTHVAIPRQPNKNLKAKAKYVAQNPVNGLGAAWEHLRRRQSEARLEDQLAAALDVAATSMKFEEVRVEHHLAHIASAYYCSPFDQLTAGFSYDASGDFVSAMAARCEGNSIEILDRVQLPNSLGFFYTAICQLIGFDGFGEEYKVMGLAPYGEDRFQAEMEMLVRTVPGGWFELAPGYFGMHEGGESGALDDASHIAMGRLYSDKLVELLGPKRHRNAPLEQRHKDLAKSCQVRFQRVAHHCLMELHNRVQSPRVAYAGGCALNGVANALFLRETPFEDAYLQCASSDDGTSLGAALWAYHNVAGGKHRFQMQHAYWGRSHTQAEIEVAVASTGMPVVTLEDSAPKTVARLLNEGLVVAWYQGRSEWGPRALGNRSILASPLVADMKDTINAKIKKRESFRPFAPSVLKEKVGTYFEQDVFSPFMMHVVRIRDEWRSRLPAITHVDGTGRLQSIARETNPRYYELIEEFGRRSGASIVLNTSFNENEPIVDTPQQAIDCFMRTDLDAICLDDILCIKAEHTELVQNFGLSLRSI